jgi:hypothetical protein
MSLKIRHIGPGMPVHGGVAELFSPPADRCLVLTNLLHGGRVRALAAQLPEMPNSWRSGHKSHWTGRALQGKSNGMAILVRANLSGLTMR